MSTENKNPHPAAGTRFDQFKNYRFGSNEFRNYFRTVFIEREAGFEYLKHRNGIGYVIFCWSLIFSIVVIVGSQVDFTLTRHWVLLPIYFLIYNLVEYLVHRYPMHMKLGPHNALFAHVTIHHNHFSDDYAYVEQHRDLMALVLPWYAFLGLSVVGAVFGFLLNHFVGRQEALFFVFAAYCYYLLYEILHAAYHAPPQSFIKKIPFIPALAQLHLDHHRAGNMTRYNFNITFPVFDLIFGTLQSPSPIEKRG